MRRSLAALALLLIAAATLFFLFRGGVLGPRPATIPALAPGIAEPTTTSDLAEAEAEIDRTPVATSTEPVVPLAPEIDAALAADADQREVELTYVRGTVLRADGSPALDANLELYGWEANSDRVARYGLPKEPWKDVNLAPNSDGSFEIAFEAPRAFQFVLEIRAPWAASLNWRWSSLAPGSTTDLGTVSMPPGGRVEGRVVLPDGSPAPGLWSVRLTDTLVSPVRSSPETITTARVEGAAKTFAFDGVALGSVEVELYSSVVPQQTQWVDVVAGRTTEVVFVHDGPPADRRVAISFIDHYCFVFGEPDMAAVQLRAIDSDAVVFGSTAIRNRNSYVFDGVEPGRHVLRVDDPRFAPFESEPIEAGGGAGIRLTGSVELTLVVTRNGTPVENATFEFGRPSGRDPMLPGVDYIPTVQRVAADGEYVLATVPDPQVWRIAAPGAGNREVDFGSGFEPHSKQRIEIALEDARSIRGTVLRSSGAPAADVVVHARCVVDEPPSSDDYRAQNAWVMSASEREALMVVTSADGSFEFGPLDNETYDLFTEHDPMVCAIAQNVAAGARDVRLVLAPAGRLSGRVQPEFEGRDGLTVELDYYARMQRVPARVRPFFPQPPHVVVDTDGHFDVEDLPVGAHELKLRMPGVTTRTANGSHTTGGRMLAPVPYTIAADTTTAVIVEVGDELPLQARVRVNDVLGSGASLVVHASRHNAERDTWSRDAAGNVGADGLAIVAPLRPGRWRFELRSTDATWTLSIPGEHEITALETFELSFDAELVRGRVTIQDQSGAPVARLALGFDALSFGSSISTDEQGIVDLVLPVGTHQLKSMRSLELSPGSQTPARLPDIVWTRDGPADPVVVLVPAE